MSQRNRVIVVVVAVGLVMVVAFAVQTFVSHAKIVEVEGTITYLDAPARKAALKFVSPRDGILRELSCAVPPDCSFRLDGAPAALEDLKTGDRARVTARWDTKNKRIVPLSVVVERAAEDEGVTTSSASSPAGR